MNNLSSTNDIFANEWEKRAQRSGLQAVMSTRWSQDQCKDITEKLIMTIFTFLGTIRDTTVLDLGCGIGRFTKILCKQAKHVYAVDFSPTMLEKAKESIHDNNVSFILCPVYNIPLPAKSVDFVFEVTVIEHLVDDKQFTETLKEIKRVTKPKGSILLCGEFGNKKYQYSPYTVVRSIDDYQNILKPWVLTKQKIYRMTDIVTNVYPSEYLITLWKISE